MVSPCSAGPELVLRRSRRQHRESSRRNGRPQRVRAIRTMPFVGADPPERSDGVSALLHAGTAPVHPRLVWLLVAGPNFWPERWVRGGLGNACFGDDSSHSSATSPQQEALRSLNRPARAGWSSHRTSSSGRLQTAGIGITGNRCQHLGRLRHPNRKWKPAEPDEGVGVVRNGALGGSTRPVVIEVLAFEGSERVHGVAPPDWGMTQST